MDRLIDDPQMLAKFHECAHVLIQSSQAKEVKLGYQMLEIVDRCMAQLKGSAD